MLKRFLPILALLALTLLFFHKLAFTDLILARGDTFAYFYPYWGVRNIALLNGQLPLWTPNLFMGAPLLANSQLGTFYPPNWLLIGLAPPDGIRVSILLHIFWALLGTYALAHQITGNRLSALAAAVVFGLGGYTGAHVEQINQLQGIAWMPWLFLFYTSALNGSPLQKTVWLNTLLLGAGLALQFLSGHTQTVFITGVGLGVYGLTQSKHWRQIGMAVLVLALASLIALPLIVPQLIPTLELTDVSNRSGGLNQNQATAFSFNPLVMGRGLLPSYDGLVFGEYVAYGGVIGFGLAIIGALTANRQRWAWLVLVGVALALALGEFNPLYWVLAGLPGFNWFRVPARWLALFALGVAMLAGLGVQRLIASSQPVSRRTLAIIGVVIAGLAVSSTLITQTPEDVIGSAAPTAITWVGWSAALVVFLGLALIRRPYLAVPALIVELFCASLIMPFNILSTPDTYASQRFSISQMRAYGAEQTPPGRVLSITNLLFDPGDRAALEARYRRYGLSELSIRLGLVDTKMKEALGANLPLIWDIPSVDGFDGGVLPTAYYTAFTSLMLPPGEMRTLDGRLREILAQEACRGACIPDQRWLNLTNTRYLLTDKIYDVWHEGVAYDTQFTQADATNLRFEPFDADTVDVLCASCNCPDIRLADLDFEASEPTSAGDNTRCRLQLDEAHKLASLEINTSGIQAVTLVDSRTGDFVQLVSNPNWQRVLSSDIKLYENQVVLPRAFVVHEAVTVLDDHFGTEDALNLMRDPNFDPAQTVILSGHPTTGASHDSPVQSTATISSYSAERVEIAVHAAEAGYLLLTDAYYPGWVATINDQPAAILRADVMFRAVPVPAGESTVVFRYQPAWLPSVLIVGVVGWIVWLIALTAATLRGTSRDKRGGNPTIHTA